MDCFEVANNKYRFSRRDIQLLVTLTMWIRDADGQPLSDGTKSQVMLWRRGRQGTLRISGLFDAIVNSENPDERGWVQDVIDDQVKWQTFAQEQYESLEEALYINPPRNMVSSEQLTRLVDHKQPVNEGEGTMLLAIETGHDEVEEGGNVGDASVSDHQGETMSTCQMEQAKDNAAKDGTPEVELAKHGEIGSLA